MEKKSWSVYERRRETLKKKASELSSLCNVSVCVLCFGPGGDFASWPEDPTEAINAYLRASASNTSKRRRKEKLDLSDILDSEINALHKQLQDRTRTAADPLLLWDEQLDLLPKESLSDLSGCLESKIQAIDHRIALLNAQSDHGEAALVQNLLHPIHDHRLIIGDAAHDHNTWVGF